MKLHLADRSSKLNNSFTARLNSFPHFLKLWHYHPELELILIVKSKGTKFIGDSISKFDEGEVLLIGENLPHMFFNDEEYFSKNSNLVAEAIVIHFRKDFLKYIPEMNHILKLFEKAYQGIHFIQSNEEISAIFQKILITKSDFDKTLLLIRLLNGLATQNDFILLASKGFSNTFTNDNNGKLDKVYQYIFKNFNRTITLKTAADIANMNESAFSRLFKRINKKPFSKYLNEIRIGYACKLLLEDKCNIATICYESGFNNLSNFNRQFKAITSFSPSEYLKKHMNI